MYAFFLYLQLIVMRTMPSSDGPGVKLIPTHYYGGNGKLVLKTYPWLSAATDGVLFYFRNDKGGQSECGQPSAANGGLCTPPNATSGGQATVDRATTPLPCSRCCLSGARAEFSLVNIDTEINDFADAMPTSHPLHVGLYFTGFSNCVSPSAAYVREASDPQVHHARLTHWRGCAGKPSGVTGAPCQRHQPFYIC